MLEDVCVESYELYSYKPLTQRLSYGEVRAAINKAVTEGVAGGGGELEMLLSQLSPILFNMQRVNLKWRR